MKSNLLGIGEVKRDEKSFPLPFCHKESENYAPEEPTYFINIPPAKPFVLSIDSLRLNYDSNLIC